MSKPMPSAGVEIPPGGLPKPSRRGPYTRVRCVGTVLTAGCVSCGELAQMPQARDRRLRMPGPLEQLDAAEREARAEVLDDLANQVYEARQRP